ncbi:hypothetical protein D770_14705 [Flammeovirgaceae bacterium 311]|nr:hypothetical protein D770_14705 [Flammeovirgaceae bacterium 311]
MNLLFLSAAHGQQNKPLLQRNCSAVEVLEQQLSLHPERAEAIKAIEEHTSRFIQKQQGAQLATGIITIPVVVHVVYNNSTQNISDAQIKSQIAVLNEDFRRANADADNTWSQAADVEIEFKLATVNYMGTSTKGITRTSTSVSSFSTNDAVKFSNKGGRNAWPADSYLNIWVCNLSGNTLGYAQFPGAGPANTDGVVISYKYFGTTGTATAPFNKGRTATHEVGHWLNLNHIWGDGGCGVDDNVSDTPVSDAPNYGCARSHVSCGTKDMVQNYMDYSDDACMNLFTAGQKARMQALFGNGGIRASLLNSPGLGGGGTTTPPASCSTNEVKLKLLLDNFPTETSWQLSSSNGSIVASGGPYNTAGATINETFCLPDGCYDFVITDSYGDGICCSHGNGNYSLTGAGGKVLASSNGSFGTTETKNICLGSSNIQSCAVLNFNDYSISSFADQEGGGTYQVQESGASLFVSGNTWKQIPLSYTVTANTVLEFEYRSTRRGEVQGISFDNDERISPETTFKVYGSQNLGIANYNNYSGTDWKKYTIPVGSFFTGSFTKLVFVGDDDRYGNQTSYFRNVKIFEGSCGSTRLSDLRTAEQPVIGWQADLASGINLHPNPGIDVLNLELNGEKHATATLYSITGKQVWKGTLKESQPVSIDVSALPSGIYTLRSLGESGTSYVQKFIKE